MEEIINMTVVELYDEKPINNIVGALSFTPDKIIYVGGLSKNHFNNKKLPILLKYFNNKELTNIEIEYVQVNKNSLNDIVSKLEEIYLSNMDCKFHVEVTGGEDLILVGLGIICDRHPEIELYQISSKLRTVRSYSLANSEGVKKDVMCRNTVEDNLLLHGASIVHSNGNDTLETGLHWGIEFLHDISIMWNICCNGTSANYMSKPSYPNLWNKVTTILSEIDKEFSERNEENIIEIEKRYFNEVILGKYNDELFHSYLYCFVRNNLMDYVIGEEKITLRFKNDQIRLCLTKAGLLLELKTYLICCNLLGSRGGDCRTGVTIDWDGDDDLNNTIKYLYDPDDPSSTIDTLNEVDVIGTCGLVPYFISCKNGRFTSEELYKLYSVGEQFGKGYCKKIIVTTNLTYALGQAKNLILQRAADMGIVIIENVQDMDDEVFEDALFKAMELPKQKVGSKN